jgi:hypothetical protein
MPWSTRNLSSLMRQGVYVNDYPGLQLDSERLNYFHGHFPLEEGQKVPPVEELESILEEWSQEHQMEHLNILYWDLLGNALFLTPSTPPPNLRMPWQGKSVALDALENLILYRDYSAEGSHGVRKVTYEEKKPVYFALEKFLGTYLRGWRGLFINRNPADRRQLFDNFGPQKTFGFFGDGSLYNAHLRFFLNREDFTRAKHFKEINLTIPQVEWEDVATVK